MDRANGGDSRTQIRRNAPFSPIFTVSLLLLIAACSNSAFGSIHGGDGSYHLSVEIVESVPHDNQSFTQGLLIEDGRMYESSGGWGESALREIDVNSGEVLRFANLSEDEFGEGIAAVNGQIIQLTWVSGIAHVWDIETFEVVDNYSYEGQGWGLCFDAVQDRLVMSNGSSELTFRDPNNFDVIGTVQVLMDGNPLSGLNELECVSSEIWANVWHQDIIVVINPATGEVVNEINATGLLTAEQSADSNVLNGIAVGEDDTIWLTGKDWPLMFNVTLLDVPDEVGEQPDDPPEEDQPFAKINWQGILLSFVVVLFIMLMLYAMFNRGRKAKKLKDVGVAQQQEGGHDERR
jgi:glutamine cyclotransferase